ncbi:DUF4280 domain-containing protein [Chryseobacterium salipaludis]|uniref:DUF4280 domain-containing protein n=1 Tax=Chryseobacterium TaxID=59732 RepID=UPI001FF5312B|nr:MULTISPECIES: DUF4280 domain-containing protein [Chryseobacterium]MCJ8497623.1 DUF4280 domain-containing protein [Chryseobacterium salipaludis]MCX3296032.1 DUF4280 domain-containing protein [Planobacterium sp. JC490]
MESLKQGELVPGSFPPVHRSNVRDQDPDESISDYSDETRDEGVDTMDDAEETESATELASSEDRAEEKETEESESSSGAHDGKYFVVQNGTCQCNQGFKFPKFKVTSHQKHYWNDAEGQADYLAVTEDDLTLDPPAAPFRQCKLKPSSGGYLPCTYAPAGKWQKPYEKVKVMGKSCLTEISELQCAVGGKITIFKHGQQSEAGRGNVAKAKAKEQAIYNPVMDFEEFQEEMEDDYSADYH